MKTLIVQLFLGRGSLSLGDPNAASEANTLFSISMASVQTYAVKYGYDYKLVTSKYGFSFFKEDYKNNCFERYANLYSQEYDRIVYIDNDILILPWTPKLPQTSIGIYGVDESHDEYGMNIMREFREQHPLCDENTPLLNTGMMIIDRDTGKKLEEYVKGRNLRKDPPKTENCRLYKLDQGMIAEYFTEYPDDHNLLPHEWNYIVRPFNRFGLGVPDKVIGKGKPYFIHPVGSNKFERYAFVLDEYYSYKR